MKITRKDEVKKPIFHANGEKMFPLFGRDEKRGGTIKHSIAHSVIPSGKSSVNCYHRITEESLYILKGKATVLINNQTSELLPGDTCVIMPHENHQISNNEHEDLEFLTINAPAWNPDDTYFP